MRLICPLLTGCVALVCGGAPTAALAGTSVAPPGSGGALAGTTSPAGTGGALAGSGGALAGTTSPAGTGGALAGTGGAGLSATAEPLGMLSHPTISGDVATIVDGVAYAPSGAPLAVRQAIWAGDRIRRMPYVLGGGHGRWRSRGYDCSGSVSYVLHAAGLLKIAEDSGQLESWGRRGLGQWITVYTNAGHAFIEIAGIRLDTSAEGDPDPSPGTGPRWRPPMHGTRGFQARHPAAY